MKKLAVIIITLLSLCLYAGGQDFSVLDKVRGNRLLLSGCEGPYRFDAPELTPAPDGYAPVYISHYGRHGSRYAWDDATYKVIKKTLDAAERASSMTERGRQLKADFDAFYEVPLMNTGDLTELGCFQHEGIAAQMARSFPEVFGSGGTVIARSSTSQRAIVSMQAFCVSLQKHAPGISVMGTAFHTDMPVTNAWSSPSPIMKRYEGRVDVPEPVSSFAARLTDYDGIFDNLFTDRGFLEEIGGRSSFVSELFILWCGYHNYTDGQWLEDIFTPEQQLSLWEVENYAVWASHSSARYLYIPLLQDIVSQADDALDGGSYKAHLRFGHDTVVNGLITLINLNGYGFAPSSADEVKYSYQTFNVPMASNIQFVFYRSETSPEVLFKVLHNGAEAALPQIEPVQGPYYSWAAFKSWCESLFASHPEVEK